MKNTILRNSIVILAVILLPALMCAAQAGAVEYKSAYRGIRTQPVYGIATTAAAPSATFQSTSAYASPEWAEESSLNSDGSVNEEVYMAETETYSTRPRRVKDPDDDDDDRYNGPVGDALIPLALLACAYAIYKVSRRRKEA
jgi:hypothetical protein